MENKASALIATPVVLHMALDAFRSGGEAAIRRFPP